MSNALPYAIAKATQAHLHAATSAAQTALKAIPGVGTGTMGLTPDSVKTSAEYRLAKSALDAAFTAERAFNSTFTKQFAKEIRAERKSLGR